MHVIRKLPIIVLHPTERCNSRCLMCDYWRLDRPRSIDMDAVEALLPRWRELGVEHVALSGGEPLLHPEIGSMCRLIKSGAFTLTLMTNGLLLEQAAEEILPYVDDIVVSLDGPPTIHERIRNLAGAFKNLERGVAKIGKIRPDLNIVGRCTVQMMNHAHLCETIETARGLGLSQISFLAVDAAASAFRRKNERQDKRKQRLGLSAPQIATLRRELDRMETGFAADFHGGYIVESADKLKHEIAGYFKYQAGLADFHHDGCNAPWVSAVIEADGTVKPCFFQPPLGSVRQNDLIEILNSDTAGNFRRRLDIRKDPVCRRCVCNLNYRQ